jgi:hypothetical protein
MKIKQFTIDVFGDRPELPFDEIEPKPEFKIGDQVRAYPGCSFDNANISGEVAHLYEDGRLGILTGSGCFIPVGADEMEKC